MATTSTFSTTALLIVVVLILVAGGAAAGYVYYRERPSGAPSVTVVQVGDNVTVNYIGIFGSGPDSGKVFDTSLFTVATNNIAYPKSLQYHPRGAFASNYTPLDVFVGGSTPSGGYTLGGLTFIQVVTGFWQGLVGVQPNTTKTIIVPPDLGYGPVNTACEATLPLSYSIPVVQTIAGVTFSKDYPGIVASTGAQFPDPHFGWPILILSANASFVTLENLPPVGWSASPAGWPVDVTNVTSTANGTGKITLVNEIAASEAGRLVGTDYLGTGPCSSQSSGSFIVTDVNLADGTYTEDYNQEVQGQTLIFLVTVVDVFP